MKQTLEQLTQQRNDINNQFLQRLHDDKVHIKILGDSMAEAATNINGQGYVGFVNARETFLAEIDRIVEEYSLFMCSDARARVSCPK